MSESVAVLGAGKMGAAMAARLAAAGWSVRVWNRSPERARALAGTRVSAYDVIGDAVAGCRVAVVILANGSAVRDTLLAAPLPADLVVVEASTIDPGTIAEVGAELGDRLVSGVVSGTPAVIAAGNASLLISGPAPAKAVAEPVLTAIAADVVDLGDSWADAKLIKIGINAVLAGTAELLAESALLLEAHGVDRSQFAAALDRSVLASPFARYKLTALVARDYAPTFATKDLRKDVGLALDEADRAGVELPFAALLHTLLSQAIDRGYGEQDFLSLFKRLQAASGREID